MNAIAKYSDSQLALIKRTVANGLTNDEFNMFVELCKRNRLDPFRGQASPVVFNAKNADKRRVALVVGIDGLRAIADRLDTYAPSEDAPEYEIDENLKGPTNPLGIVKCTVYVNKLRAGRWFKTPGVAYWEEFAPVTDEWAWCDQSGKRKPTGKKAVGGKWADMPRHMIAIAAERQALRKGWPDAFGDVYADEEVAKHTRAEDGDASAAVERLEAGERAKRIGGRAITFAVDPHEPLEAWPVGKVADKITEFLDGCNMLARLEWFQSTNREALKQFWAESSGDALEVKKAIEAKARQLAQEAA